MKLLLPLLLALFGLVGGAGAGWMMKPPPPDPCAAPVAGSKGDAEGEAAPDAAAAACAEGRAAVEPPRAPAGEPPKDSAFVEFPRQFIVPVSASDGRDALMVLTLVLETPPGAADAVRRREPKLRDALLRTLFEHAATGGFDGDFTSEALMRDLRRNMAEAARAVAGPDVRDVLVSDIVRQTR